MLQLNKPIEFKLNNITALGWLNEVVDKLNLFVEHGHDGDFSFTYLNQGLFLFNYSTITNRFLFSFSNIEMPMRDKFGIDYDEIIPMMKILINTHQMFNNIPNKETIEIL